MKNIIHSLNELDSFAKENAKWILENKNSEIYILLNGDLGAGKTTFTKALLKYLNVQDNVSSPTFNILNQYNQNNLVINHMDAYRIEKGSDLDMYLELFEDAINVIEWSDNLGIDFKNKTFIDLRISIIDENIREILIERSN